MDEIKRKLLSYKKDQIFITPHVKLKLVEREIQEEMIYNNLLNPEKLVDFEEQKSKRAGERKYKLIFELSNARYFIIIVAINKYINVVTVFIRYRKWLKDKATGGK
ncbi:TPA: DUF4258 domain-containing protein [archaeon]|nr:DUF4258 domain-containing protein [Candidatus Naiadarchaeales archaeon SRR2090153.bin1042]